MAVVVCTAALNNGGFRAEVGQVFDSANVMVVKYPSFFTTAVSHGTVTEAANVKGIYYTGVISVTVPSITNPAHAKVDVDISPDPLVYVAAVGDAVIAIPMAALPTNARLLGAWVTANDSVQVTFGSETGNVVGAAVNFKFLCIDLT